MAQPRTSPSAAPRAPAHPRRGTRQSPSRSRTPRSQPTESKEKFPELWYTAGVTWGFLYLAILLVGLILVAIFGVLETLHVSTPLALPRAELARHRRQVHIARLGAGAAAFGGAGLVLVTWWRTTPSAAFLTALAASLVCWLVCRWVFRLPCPPSVLQQKATVLRDIPPGGYGQVRLEGGGASTVLAAQSESDEPIPAGTEVEVVDCQRSVVVVRKISPSP